MLPTPEQVFNRTPVTDVISFIKETERQMLNYTKKYGKASRVVTIEFEEEYMPLEYMEYINSLLNQAKWRIVDARFVIGGQFVSSFAIEEA